MKKNLSLLIPAMALLIILANLESCSHYHGLASKPNGHNHYHPDFAMLHIAKHHRNNGVKQKQENLAVSDKANSEQLPTVKTPSSKFIAQLSGDAPFQAKLPKFMAKDIDDDKMEKVNDALAKYSDHKVSISKTANGKVVLHADSRKEFFKLSKTLMEMKKSPAPIDDNTRDILALAGGICGIVAIGLFVIPFANFVSIPAGLGGIVLGALGLQSTNRHKWALLGIILGSIGLVLAIVMILIYAFLVFF